MPAEDGFALTFISTAYLGEAAAPEPEPIQQELELTRAQWVMLQHQARSLAASGILRGFESLDELTPEELGHYLWARQGDWGGAGPEIILQADFSSENGVWGGRGCLSAWAREEGAELKALAPEPTPESGSVSFEYAREGGGVLVTARIPSGSSTAVMRYTFGLVPEGTGPISRTFCEKAEFWGNE